MKFEEKTAQAFEQVRLGLVEISKMRTPTGADTMQLIKKAAKDFTMLSAAEALEWGQENLWLLIIGDKEYQEKAIEAGNTLTARDIIAHNIEKALEKKLAEEYLGIK